KLPVRRDIAAHHIDMINAFDRATTPYKFLWLIDEFCTELWRRHILLHIVIDLQQVPIGIFELVSSSMPDIPINPPFSPTTGLDRLHPSIKCLRGPGPQANVP